MEICGIIIGAEGDVDRVGYTVNNGVCTLYYHDSCHDNVFTLEGLGDLGIVSLKEYGITTDELENATFFKMRGDSVIGLVTLKGGKLLAIKSLFPFIAEVQERQYNGDGVEYTGYIDVDEVYIDDDPDVFADLCDQLDEEQE